jgi:hypothetical protein
MPRTPKAARAEAARRNLQILGVVLTVLDGDSGHRRQRFGSVDPRIVGTDAPGVDDIDGAGQVEAAMVDAAAGDHDRIERRRRRVGGGQTGRGDGQNGNGAPQASVHVGRLRLREQGIGWTAFWPCRAVDRKSARSTAGSEWPAFHVSGSASHPAPMLSLPRDLLAAGQAAR